MSLFLAAKFCKAFIKAKPSMRHLNVFVSVARIANCRSCLERQRQFQIICRQMLTFRFRQHQFRRISGVPALRKQRMLLDTIQHDFDIRVTFSQIKVDLSGKTVLLIIWMKPKSTMHLAKKCKQKTITPRAREGGPLNENR